MTNASERFPPYPKAADGNDGDQYDAQQEWYETVARGLDPGEVDVLIGLFRHGPLFDGDVPSKEGRNVLLDLDLCTKIVVSGEAQPGATHAYQKPNRLAPLADQATGRNGWTDGYNAATNRAVGVYRALMSLKIIDP